MANVVGFTGSMHCWVRLHFGSLGASPTLFVRIAWRSGICDEDRVVLAVSDDLLSAAAAFSLPVVIPINLCKRRRRMSAWRLISPSLLFLSTLISPMSLPGFLFSFLMLISPPLADVFITSSSSSLSPVKSTISTSFDLLSFEDLAPSAFSPPRFALLEDEPLTSTFTTIPKWSLK